MATKLLLFLPIANVFTALLILFVLSIINRYRYRIKNILTYLIVNTLIVSLMAVLAFVYFYSKSTLNLSELFSQIDISSITNFKDSLLFLLAYMQETFMAIPIINSVIFTFMTDKITISFFFLVASLLVINILLFCLINENISRHYLRNASLENNQTNRKKSKAYLTKSRWGNYIQRELWVINSESYFKMQVVLTILLPPVFSIIGLIGIQNGWISDDLTIFKGAFFNTYFSYAILFLSFANNMSGTPYSREGKYHYLIKTMPFHHHTLYLSKVGVTSILNLSAVFISFIIFALFGYWNMESTVMLLIVSCLIVCYNLLAPLFDMKNPRVEWTNPSEAIKSNPNVLVSLLFGMPIPIVITGIHFSLLWVGFNPLASALIVLPVTVLTTIIIIILLKSKIHAHRIHS